jgi:hypothetical protein
VPHLGTPKTKKLGRAIDNDGFRLSIKTLAGALTRQLHRSRRQRD